MLLEISGEITPESMKGWSQSKNNTQSLKECGSMAAAKEKGLVRSEGKEYVMQDGDVTLFRFNV